MFLSCWQRPHHAIKSLFYRFRDGAGPCDTYSLKMWIAPKIIRWIKAYKRDSAQQFGGYPAFLSQEGDKDGDGLARWTAILDEMINGFQYIIDDPDYVKEEHERAEKGRALFGKYFDSLWR